LAKFTEGLLFGILGEQYTDLDKCIAEDVKLENNLIDAYNFFKEETFDGIKKGLEEIGKTVREIPNLVEDCSSIKADLKDLITMA